MIAPAPLIGEVGKYLNRDLGLVTFTVMGLWTVTVCLGGDYRRGYCRPDRYRQSLFGLRSAADPVSRLHTFGRPEFTGCHCPSAHRGTGHRADPYDHFPSGGGMVPAEGARAYNRGSGYVHCLGSIRRFWGLTSGLWCYPILAVNHGLDGRSGNHFFSFDVNNDFWSEGTGIDCRGTRRPPCRRQRF